MLLQAESECFFKWLLDHSDLGKGSKVTRNPYLLAQERLKDWPLLGFFFFCLLEHIKGDWSPSEQFPCCPVQSSSDLALEQVGNDPLGNILVESIIYRSDGWSLCPFSLSLVDKGVNQDKWEAGTSVDTYCRGKAKHLHVRSDSPTWYC